MPRQHSIMACPPSQFDGCPGPCTGVPQGCSRCFHGTKEGEPKNWSQLGQEPDAAVGAWQLSQHLLERAEIPPEVPGRVVLTFMMHPHVDDKEAIATALCKKAELLGCTGMSRSSSNKTVQLCVCCHAILG